VPTHIGRGTSEKGSKNLFGGREKIARQKAAPGEQDKPLLINGISEPAAHLGGFLVGWV
jgi:hypothetical protein